MSTQHNTPSALNGQPQSNDNQIPSRDFVFEHWTQQAELAIDALFVWKAWLRAWQLHPNVTDAAFMQAVQGMAEAGLSEWLDANQAGLDALRKEVTGGVQ